GPRAVAAPRGGVRLRPGARPRVRGRARHRRAVLVDAPVVAARVQRGHRGGAARHHRRRLPPPAPAAAPGAADGVVDRPRRRGGRRRDRPGVVRPAPARPGLTRRPATITPSAARCSSAAHRLVGIGSCRGATVCHGAVRRPVPGGFMHANAHPPARRPARGWVRPAVAGLGLVALAASGLTYAATSAGAADLPETYLGSATTWSYSDDNTDPAAGDADRLTWTYAGFDDTAWKRGTGPFGAKNGSPTPDLGPGFPVSTVLDHYVDPGADPRVAVPTYHLRTTFDVTADQLEAITSLQGEDVFDDAVQIFVNGTKVAGFADERVESVPDDRKNLTYAGTAAGDPVERQFSVPAEVLEPGVNTLAVGLYNDRPASSDVYLDVRSLVPVEQDEPEPTTTVTDLV